MELKDIPSFDEIKDLDTGDDKIQLISELVDKNKPQGDRFGCGFDLFDKAMEGGFKEGDLVVISGISGQGKTSLAQTMTYHLCKKAVPCLWFSYEVGLEHLNAKFLKMGIEDFYQAYAPKKNTTGKLEWVKGKIREGWIKFATKVIFIDHIDFLTPTDIKTSDNETIALKKIATELKSLAIELNVVIVVMAHLKKLPEGKEPDMQDIGYSAGIFQLADYVLIIYREKEKKGKFETNDTYSNNSKIKIVKNRQTGQLKFLKVNYVNERFIETTEYYEEPPLSNYDRVREQ
jgi:replicative DNA helicase